MESKSIARCVRNNTHFISFNIAVNSFTAASALTTASIAHVVCPAMATERT